VDAAAQGETHISVQCHRKKTVAAVAERLGKVKGWRVITLTGASTPGQRDKLRHEARDADHIFLVSTIDATSVGIDLTFCGQAIYAELVDSLKDMLQSLGRYQRLVPGSTPTTVTWVLQDKNDKQALRLAKKVKAYGMVMRQDFGGGKMEAALSEVQANSGLDRNEVLELLALATGSHNPEALDLGED
jgi:superfamily II DNA or RNA helicase